MYENGEGVDNDPVVAAKWHSLAAEQGHAASQSNLAIMYVTGDGVSKNYEKALYWFNLAAARSGKSAAKKREVITRMMAPGQIAEAQKLAREWSSGSE